MSFDNTLNSHSIEAYTEKLSAQAAKIKTVCNDIVSHIQATEKIADLIEYYWSSDSSQLAHSLFNEDKNKYSDIKSILLNKISQLDKIIELYENNESKLKNISENLPGSIIE